MLTCLISRMILSVYSSISMTQLSTDIPIQHAGSYIYIFIYIYIYVCVCINTIATRLHCVDTNTVHLYCMLHTPAVGVTLGIAIYGCVCVCVYKHYSYTPTLCRH